MECEWWAEARWCRIINLGCSTKEMGSYSKQKGKIIWDCIRDTFRWEMDINRMQSHNEKVNSFSVLFLS